MFEKFSNSLLDWMEIRNLKAWTAASSPALLQKPEYPPKVDELWDAYLRALIPEKLHVFIFTEPAFNKKFLDSFTSLSPYSTDQHFVKLIEHSVLSTLQTAAKDKIAARAQSFSHQINIWVSGEIHRKLNKEPWDAFHEINEKLQFDNKWSCAEFLSRLGYVFPYSRQAYKAWKRWKGESQEDNSYGGWVSNLQSIHKDFSEQFVLDRSLNLVFNPSGPLGSSVFCQDARSCANCPVMKNCAFYQNHCKNDCYFETFQNIKTGETKGIKTKDLISFINKDYQSFSDFDEVIVKHYPDITNALFCEADTIKKEQYLARILAIIELFERRKSHKQLEKKKTFSCAQDLYEHFAYDLRKEKQESFHTVILNNKHQVINVKLITLGTLNQSLVHPREVFAPAIQLRAASIILIHNHPSGDPSPSNQDISITQRLKEVGDLVGIKVLDHIIIGKNDFFSFVDDNLL